MSQVHLTGTYLTWLIRACFVLFYISVDDDSSLTRLLAAFNVKLDPVRPIIEFSD